MATWTWETATPSDRAIWVRDSMRHCRQDLRALCDLFQLTEDGAVRILNGDIWRPEYERR